MIDALLQDIKRHYRKVPQAEVPALYRRATKGDQEAYERLYWSVVGLAVKYARIVAVGAKRGGDVLLIHELILAGIEGICAGIHSKKYQARKGYWTTYITYYIRGHILRAMYYNDLIRIPPVPKLKGARCIPLTIHLMDIVRTSEPRLYDPDELDKLYECIQQLPPLAREIIQGYYLEEGTLQSVGDRLGVTREAIRIRRDKALKKLRANWDDYLLRKVMDGFHGN